MSELNNATESFNNRLDQAEESINSNIGNLKLSRRKRMKMSKESLKDLWYTIK